MPPLSTVVFLLRSVGRCFDLTSLAKSVFSRLLSLLRLPLEKPKFREALEGYVAFVLQNGSLTRLALSAANRQKVVAQFRRGNCGVVLHNR